MCPISSLGYTSVQRRCHSHGNLVSHETSVNIPFLVPSESEFFILSLDYFAFYHDFFVVIINGFLKIAANTSRNPIVNSYMLDQFGIDKGSEELEISKGTLFYGSIFVNLSTACLTAWFSGDKDSAWR